VLPSSLAQLGLTKPSLGAWQGSGVIICISDVEAVHTGPKHAAYAASKYALRGFCKSAYEVSLAVVGRFMAEKTGTP
jgi:NAD(P)-dependent dehydrogenase (short-subunit alcohol dehydrogenase family)